ncbi:type VII secretion system-associated protein [Saccharopolyspora shandongensis]|uniref:type VII secretion system-associated protein n=1 Tax=Saccharopolyspora shandongensis TaxID=418495 RepID=UPI00344786B6
MNPMDPPGPSAEAGRWHLVTDPAWQAADEQDQPPVTAVVGGWYLDDDGVVGRFQPNPDYEPSSPGLPTDPVDAAMQRVADGGSGDDEVLERLRQVRLGIAISDEGKTIVAPAPDDVPAVLVTTAAAHRERVRVDRWLELTIGELAAGTTKAGVDVLLNPGAAVSMRIQADALKRFVVEKAPESNE